MPNVHTKPRVECKTDLIPMKDQMNRFKLINFMNKLTALPPGTFMAKFRTTKFLGRTNIKGFNEFLSNKVEQKVLEARIK